MQLHAGGVRVTVFKGATDKVRSLFRGEVAASNSRRRSDVEQSKTDGQAHLQGISTLGRW